MSMRSHFPRLIDSVEAIMRIKCVLQDVSLEAFEADREKQWLVDP